PRMLDRRSFLVRTGLALGTGVLAAGCRPRLELVRGEAADLQDWRAVRGELNLSRDYIHLTGFLLASHPPPVREAIATHRRRTGASVRAVSLYANPATATEEEITEAVVRALKPRTRVVAVTWVHSCTGVKLPIRRIADALAEINAQRDDGDRALLCVDGVHGIGVDDATMADLGCDFFVAGTHKWVFGPRGTGLVWGKSQAWPAATAIIPTFNRRAGQIWVKAIPPEDIPPAALMTPGGFHSFEHRWALGEAFRFHQ